MQKILIHGQLINPPTETLAFRDFTYLLKNLLQTPVLLEVEQEFKDTYFFYSKTRGLLDFVDCLIEEEELETGIRLIYFNTKLQHQPADPVIKTNAIDDQNKEDLFNKIKTLCVF